MSFGLETGGHSERCSVSPPVPGAVARVSAITRLNCSLMVQSSTFAEAMIILSVECSVSELCVRCSFLIVASNRPELFLLNSHSSLYMILAPYCLLFLIKLPLVQLTVT
jgi:hypothetical protein